MSTLIAQRPPGLYGLYTVAGSLAGSSSCADDTTADSDDVPDLAGGAGNDMSVGDSTLLLAIDRPPTLDTVATLALLRLLTLPTSGRCSGALAMYAMCSGIGGVGGNGNGNGGGAA